MFGIGGLFVVLLVRSSVTVGNGAEADIVARFGVQPGRRTIVGAKALE